MNRLDCFVAPGWEPRLRPAAQHRDWMDNTAEKFAYRCLPLAIANSHGWEITCPVSFEAQWTGHQSIESVVITLPSDEPQHIGGPVSIFGQGVLTFHIAGIFKTDPSVNLFVSGTANQPKDAISPLTGVIETDWCPFTFTMNWKFTRANTIVKFAKDEAICCVFPIPRTLEDYQPRIRPFSEDPELWEQFKLWQQSRDAFHAHVKQNPVSGSNSWQKHYFRGLNMHNKKQVKDHKTKLHLKPFS